MELIYIIAIGLLLLEISALRKRIAKLEDKNASGLDKLH